MRSKVLHYFGIGYTNILFQANKTIVCNPSYMSAEQFIKLLNSSNGARVLLKGVQHG